MKCSNENCRSEKLVIRRAPHPYVESGLKNVVLVNVPARQCEKCGTSELLIPRMAELHRLLAQVLCKKPAPLSAEEDQETEGGAGHVSRAGRRRSLVGVRGSCCCEVSTEPAPRSTPHQVHSCAEETRAELRAKPQR